jgi:hypothetical protein
MPDAPAEILYGFVTAKFTKLVQDTSDIGDQPQLENLNGKVRIEAVVPGNWLRITIPGNKSMTTLQNQEYPIVNGAMAGYGPGGAASLVAGFDNPNVQPNPFQYRATFTIDDVTVQPPPVLFSLHPDETIELTDIISMPPVAPIMTVVSNDSAVRAETAAAEAEAAAIEAQAIIDSGIGPAVESYLVENPPAGGGPEAYSDVVALPGYPTTFPPTIGSTASTAVAGNDGRLTDERVPTDGSVTNAKVASGAAISLDKTADSATRVAMTSTERTKLTGISANAINQAEVDARVQQIVGAAPAALDTLVEIATRIESDQDAVDALVGVVATKAPLASPAFTGTPTGITLTHVGATAAGASMATAATVSAQRDLLRLPDLNVKTFGALGNDGAADDTAAIQAAIDAASFGQNVTIPRGIYRITAPLVLKLGTSLVGVGAARFAHYQTTTGANTSAPAIGSVIRVGSSFVGAAAIMATASASPGYTTGAVRLRDLVIDGRGQTATPVDGFQATGVLYDARLERVTVLGMSGNGVKFQADGSSNRPLAAQLVSVMVRGSALAGFDLLFADSYLTDCYALSNTTSGFILRRMANTTMVGCRSEWNSQQGYHFTGLSGGGSTVTGCLTDRNNFNGILCDGTSDGGSLLFTGLSLRRDGRNGGTGGGGYAGFRATSSTWAIAISGFTIAPGIDDDGVTGTLSPEVGIRASGTRSLTFSDGVAHAATTPIQDSGSNSRFSRGLNVVTATGTITSPTYNLVQDPTDVLTKARQPGWRYRIDASTWEPRPTGHPFVIAVGADPSPVDQQDEDIRWIPVT